MQGAAALGAELRRGRHGSSHQEQPRNLVVPKFNRGGKRSFPVRADLANARRVRIEDSLDLADIAQRGGNRQITSRASFQEEAGSCEVGSWGRVAVGSPNRNVDSLHVLGPPARSCTS